MAAEVCQQTLVARGRENTNPSQQGGLGKHGQKPQPNQRRGFQTSCGEFRVISCDDFIKVRHMLVELGADTANQKISERREATQQGHGPIRDLSVNLRNWRKRDVTFVHGHRSATVYSGSACPYARARC